MVSFTSKWMDISAKTTNYSGPKSGKSPFETFATAFLDHSVDISPGAKELLDRLQRGQRWLTEQHNLWLDDDGRAVISEEFSRVLARWFELENLFRCCGYTGCIYGAEGSCPEGFVCIGCVDVPAPAVVAQLALTE